MLNNVLLGMVLVSSQAKQLQADRVESFLRAALRHVQKKTAVSAKYWDAGMAGAGRGLQTCDLCENL